LLADLKIRRDLAITKAPDSKLHTAMLFLGKLRHRDSNLPDFFFLRVHPLGIRPVIGTQIQVTGFLKFQNAGTALLAVNVHRDGISDLKYPGPHVSNSVVAPQLPKKPVKRLLDYVFDLAFKPEAPHIAS
jgi:hypothetical protein